MAENHFNTTPFAYVLNNPLIYIDPDGRDNIIYTYFAESVSKEDQKAIIDQANSLMKDLGLKVEVAGIDYIPNASDLDDSDSFAFVGTDKEVASFMSSEKSEGFDTFSARDVMSDNSYEVSGNPTLAPAKGNTEKDKGNAIYLMTNDSERMLNDPYQKGELADWSSQEYQGFLIVHGSGHNAGLGHSDNENTFMDSAGKMIGSPRNPTKYNRKKAARTSTKAQKKQYKSKFSSKKPNRKLK